LTIAATRFAFSTPGRDLILCKLDGRISSLASSGISSSNDSKLLVDRCIDFVWTNATLRNVASFLELKITLETQVEKWRSEGGLQSKKMGIPLILAEQHDTLN
jgi:hypothetical protein